MLAPFVQITSVVSACPGVANSVPVTVPRMADVPPSPAIFLQELKMNRLKIKKDSDFNMSMKYNKFNRFLC